MKVRKFKSSDPEGFLDNTLYVCLREDGSSFLEMKDGILKESNLNHLGQTMFNKIALVNVDNGAWIEVFEG